LFSSDLSGSSSEVTLPSESASPALLSDSEFDEESLEDEASVASEASAVVDLVSVEDDVDEASVFARDSARAIFLALMRASFFSSF
jgi:hypothetical protein